MQIYLSLLIALIGALVYALASNAKVCELGRLAFGCGLLAFLLQGAHSFGVIGR
jgi:Na+/phosphate symporter